MKLQIEPLSQRQNPWARSHLGTSEVTISGYGCVLTCVAMQVRYHGKEIWPDHLNEEMIKVGGYYKENLWVWKMLEKIYPDIKWAGRHNFETVPADLSILNDQLEKKQPVIAKVEADEIGTPKGDHFLLVIGREGGDYWVNDPWWRPSDSHPQQFKLSEYYSHNGSNKPEHIFLGFRIYEGPIVPSGPSGDTESAERAIEVIETWNATLDKKHGNTESMARALVDSHKRLQTVQEDYSKLQESFDQTVKDKVDIALNKQKDLCDKEKKQQREYWQKQLETANEKLENAKFEAIKTADNMELVRQLIKNLTFRKEV